MIDVRKRFANFPDGRQIVIKMFAMNIDPPKISPWSLMSPFGPINSAPMLAIFLLGVFAPHDILDSNDFLAAFVENVRQILLSVAHWADIASFAYSTSYPQVALLVSALHWAFLPLHILLFILLNELYLYRFGWHRWRSTRPGRLKVDAQDLKALCCVPMFGAGLGVLTMMPGDWSLADGLTTGSQVGMSTMFFIGFWISAVASAASFNIFRAFIRFNILGKTDV